MSNWDEVKRAIRRLDTLEDDWDGQGAAAPREGVVESAGRLADLLASLGAPLPSSACASPAGSIIFGWRSLDQRPEISTPTGIAAPCRIAPTPAGSICFEWQCDGLYAEIEIDEPGIGEWMIVPKDQPAQHGTIRFAGTAPVSTAVVKVP